jgi:hypothetical protein
VVRSQIIVHLARLGDVEDKAASLFREGHEYASLEIGGQAAPNLFHPRLRDVLALQLSKFVPSELRVGSGVPEIRRRLNRWATESWKEPMLFIYACVNEDT